MQTPVPAAWLAPPRLACCPSAACTRHHLHGPLLAPALQPGVHAPLCTGLLLEPPCSQTHVPYFLTPAAHARGTAVLAGADPRYSTAAETAETMHKQMRAFAAAQGPCTLQSFGESCRNAVKIFKQAAEAHWHKMFALRMSRQHDTHSHCVLLQIACLDIDVSKDLGVQILSERESVVAQLAVIVRDHTHGGDHFSVECKQVGVVGCLRHMQMELLLEACGLLCAQQFAYLASPVYRVETDCAIAPQALPDCAPEVPFDVQTVASTLWTWHTDSAHMYARPLPQQVREKAVLGKHKRAPTPEELADIIRHRTDSLHSNLLAYAKTTHNSLRIESFELALQHAADIMNQEAGEHWRRFYRFAVASAPGSDADASAAHFVCFYLEVVCTAGPSSCQCAGVQPVVARLGLNVHKQAQKHFKYRGAFSSFYVDMSEGVTVVCLRHMHLATLLRACALLAAQQFACFGSDGQTVGFEGYAASAGTKKIYEQLFHNIRVRIQPPDLRHCAVLDGRHETAAASLANVATLLTHALHSSGLLWHSPLPAQIEHKDETR